jgi:hypothetical protein
MDGALGQPGTVLGNGSLYLHQQDCGAMTQQREQNLDGAAFYGKSAMKVLDSTGTVWYAWHRKVDPFYMSRLPLVAEYGEPAF